MCTLNAADDFDHESPTTPSESTLLKIARFARKHDGVRAHVARNGCVLLTDRDGAIRSVRTMRAACEWLGY